MSWPVVRDAGRERITTLIDDCARMPAAISHDLRTPITRMRLRSEFIEESMTLVDIASTLQLVGRLSARIRP